MFLSMHKMDWSTVNFILSAPHRSWISADEADTADKWMIIVLSMATFSWVGGTSSPLFSHAPWSAQSLFTSWQNLYCKWICMLCRVLGEVSVGFLGSLVGLYEVLGGISLGLWGFSDGLLWGLRWSLVGSSGSVVGSTGSRVGNIINTSWREPLR